MSTNNKTKRFIPADGLAGLKQNFSKDAMSGFFVFLLALPLSLGIAKASDFPAIYGIVTAIIGGVVVSFFAGSRLTIKGPAAGLIVIASGAVTAFGNGNIGWHFALSAIVVAGVVQILFGVFKLGKLADFFPSAAIHGMLAAIGIIIMSKQIHTLLGIDPAVLKGKEPLELLAMIPQSILHENAHITEIGVACLVLLIILSYIKHEKIKKIPAPLVVLAVAIPLGQVLNIKTENAISNFALVKIGNIFDAFSTNGKVGDFTSNGFINADFSGIASHIGVFIQYVILFALIGTIESLLTAKAIDGKDVYKRKSDFNKDLVAVGIGNTLAGLLGGLPMISEVARSSANVDNGAVTRWANFFHGIFLLIAVVFGVAFIEMIPNAALASMLIFVGFKLAHPKEFKHMWHLGKAQFVIFVSTIVVTLATDLLLGVAFGILLKFVVSFLYGARWSDLFKSSAVISTIDENTLRLETGSALIFSNLLSFKKIFAQLPAGKVVIVDVHQSKLVDHTSMAALKELLEEYNEQGGSMEIKGFENHKVMGHGSTSARVLGKQFA